jgi:lipoprotein LpqH
MTPNTILLDDGPFDLDGSRQQKETVVKRGFVIAIGGAAVVATALTGCGGKDDKSSSSQTASASVPGGNATMGSGKATVKIDGAEKKAEGSIVCADVAGNNTVTIGNPAAQQGATVVMTSGDSPEVNQVALYFGTPILYNKGAGGGDASVKKDGKTYTVSGHSAPMPDAHEFALEITCP